MKDSGTPFPGSGLVDASSYRLDYVRDLRMAVAREELAQALYAAKATAFGLSLPPWHTLLSRTREEYRALALETVLRLEPQPRGVPPIRLVTGLGGAA